jgi:hypothetical protein
MEGNEKAKGFVYYRHKHTHTSCGAKNTLSVFLKWVLYIHISALSKCRMLFQLTGQNVQLLLVQFLIKKSEL